MGIGQGCLAQAAMGIATLLLATCESGKILAAVRGMYIGKKWLADPRASAPAARGLQSSCDQPLAACIQCESPGEKTCSRCSHDPP